MQSTWHAPAGRLSDTEQLVVERNPGVRVEGPRSFWRAEPVACHVRCATRLVVVSIGLVAAVDTGLCCTATFLSHFCTLLDFLSTMSPRTSRSKASSARGRKTTSSRTNGSKSSNKKAKRVEDADQYTESEDGDEYVADPGDDASDAESLHSDALDDEDEFETSKNSKKRKRASTSPKKTPSKSATKAKQANKNGSASGSARKKRKTKESEDEASDFELEDGQEVVGTVVQAPKTGRGEYFPSTFSCCKHVLRGRHQFHQGRYPRTPSTSCRS